MKVVAGLLLCLVTTASAWAIEPGQSSKENTRRPGSGKGVSGGGGGAIIGADRKMRFFDDTDFLNVHPFPSGDELIRLDPKDPEAKKLVQQILDGRFAAILNNKCELAGWTDAAMITKNFPFLHILGDGSVSIDQKLQAKSYSHLTIKEEGDNLHIQVANNEISLLVARDKTPKGKRVQSLTLNAFDGFLAQKISFGYGKNEECYVEERRSWVTGGIAEINRNGALNPEFNTNLCRELKEIQQEMANCRCEVGDADKKIADLLDKFKVQPGSVDGASIPQGKTYKEALAAFAKAPQKMNSPAMDRAKYMLGRCQNIPIVQRALNAKGLWDDKKSGSGSETGSGVRNTRGE